MRGESAPAAREGRVQILRVPVLQYETAQYLIETGRLSCAEALDAKLVGHAVGEVLADLWRRLVAGENRVSH